MRKLRQKEVETVFRAPAFYTEIYRPPRKMETHVKYPEYSRKKLLKKKSECHLRVKIGQCDSGGRGGQTWGWPQADVRQPASSSSDVGTESVVRTPWVKWQNNRKGGLQGLSELERAVVVFWKGHLRDCAVTERLCIMQYWWQYPDTEILWHSFAGCYHLGKLSEADVGSLHVISLRSLWIYDDLNKFT